MPQKTWVVGEEVLAADFNTYVQNQVVPRFATIAARDAAWPAATAGSGAVCITTDTGTMYVVVGGAWRPPPGALFASVSTVIPNLAATTVGQKDVVGMSGQVFAYPVKVVVHADMYCGFGSGPHTFSNDLFAYTGSLSFGGAPTPTTVAAGVFTAAPVSATYAVAAGAEAGWKLRVNPTVVGGTFHTGGIITSQWFAA